MSLNRRSESLDMFIARFNVTRSVYSAIAIFFFFY